MNGLVINRTEGLGFNPIELPRSFELGELYPNPFNKSTTLEFANDNLESFSLELYDMLGNRVRRVDNIMTERVVLKKGNLNSGIYFIELRSETQTLNGKVLVE